MAEKSIFARYIVRPIWHLYSILHQYWRPSPPLRMDPQKQSTIRGIPLVVICYLGSGNDGFSTADQAALALTCKMMWKILNGPRILRRLERPDNWSHLLRSGKWKRDDVWKLERLDLLQRLQRRFPKWPLCYQCASFHPGRIRKTIGDTACEKMNGHIYQDFYLPFHFFTEFQQVMNHHRYGEGFGIPATALNFNSPSRGRRVKLKVVDDELFLKFDTSELYYNYSFSSKRDALRNLIDRRSHCAGFCTQLSYDRLLKEEKACWYVKCPRCSCETRHMVNPTFDKRHGEARTTVWYNLGHCLNPFDAKWSVVYGGDFCLVLSLDAISSISSRAHEY